VGPRRIAERRVGPGAAIRVQRSTKHQRYLCRFGS
jgi:hypothetical protein